MTWDRAYRSGNKLGFWKVSTNIDTRDKDRHDWEWCVWNTDTRRMAFGNKETPGLILEVRLVKVVDV